MSSDCGVDRGRIRETRRQNRVAGGRNALKVKLCAGLYGLLRASRG